MRVLTRDLGGVFLAARQEVEIEHASDCVVLQRRLAADLVDLDVDAVRVEQEHAMRASRAVLEVDGVRAVQVRALAHSVRIPVPEGAGQVVVGKTERVGVLAWEKVSRLTAARLAGYGPRP